MKLHLGPVPENPAFQPEVENWSSIKEPGPWLLQLLAVPVAIVTAVFLFFLFNLVAPRGVYPDNRLTVNFSFWQPLLMFALLIPVHELLHAVCFPAFGRSDQTLIGVWPQKLLFYAYYTGELSRTRFLVSLLMPFSVLSILPILAIGVLRTAPVDGSMLTFLVILSLLNGMAASGDLLGVLLIVFQIPRGAMMRNQGWKSYWKAA